VQRRSVVEYVVNEHGCWIWQLARNSRGYGVRWDPKERRLKLAHRWYYERQHGAVPEGRQLDHLCTVRACVNPAHLEAVSPRQNVQRSVARRPRKPPRIREEPRLRPVDPAECKCWQGCRDRDGYGAKWADGKRVFVHRWVYEQVHGPIPDGLTIDHLCRNPACHNIDHLELVSRSENIQRSKWRQECRHGHPMTPQNTIWESSGKRRCRTCRTDSQERAERRRKERRRAGG
jgi:hypothetical protein